MIRDQAGNLYGITRVNDSSPYCGAVYKVAPNRTFTILYSFTNALDGCTPTSLISDQDGNFYGTATRSMAGNYDTTVFKLTTGGIFTGLHTFSTGQQPLQVNAVLPVNGTLYSTAYSSDWSAQGRFEPGILFSIAPDGTYTQLYGFPYEGGDGQGVWPVGQLALNNGKLFGANNSGGIFRSGTVFSFGVANP